MAYIVVTVAGRLPAASFTVFNSSGLDCRRSVNPLAGLQDGAPAKLYLPRDYSGAYCDFEQNWNNGPNLKGLVLTLTYLSLHCTCGDACLP